MGHYTQEEEPPGWEDFARDNAVVLLRERDRLIARLREQVTGLLHSKRALRREVAKLKGMVNGLAARVAAQSELLTAKAMRDGATG